MRINTHVAILAAAIAAVTGSDRIVRSLAESRPAPLLTLRGPADAVPSSTPVHLATARAGNEECLKAECGSPK
jgi:hypothetical protein